MVADRHLAYTIAFYMLSRLKTNIEMQVRISQDKTMHQGQGLEVWSFMSSLRWQDYMILCRQAYIGSCNVM